jgi:multicomponent Na+:H+ antiporter subunit G
VITAPVVANRVGQLAYREQAFRDDLLLRDEIAQRDEIARRDDA